MMHNFGYGYWIGPVISLIFFISWLVLEIFALLSLRKQKLSTTAQALWALVILTVPLMGAISFFIIRPHELEEA